MKIEHIDYDGKKVGFRFMEDGPAFVRARKRLGNIDYCPLCDEVFTLDNVTSVVLIVSNQVDVPNRFCHSECFGDQTPKQAFKIIADNYKRFLQFRGWISD